MHIHRRFAVLPLAVMAGCGLPLAHAVDLSGSAALTSDYVFRGISQTQGDPAAQAGFRIAGESGVYGSVWGSTVEFPGDTSASSEIDYVVGWGQALNDDWAIDVNVTYFDYLSARVDLAYAELIGTVTWRSNYWLMVGYSPDVLATDEAGTYVFAGAKFPLTDAFRFEAGAGYYALDDAYDDSYAHAQLSAVHAWAPVELRLTAHGTDSGGDDIFGEYLAGSRIEFAIQASF
jgi:uncharacterized protein (TIGR02001 family)